MFGSATSIPSLRNYDAALAYWTKTAPIRGRGDTNKRPLRYDRRANDTYTIRMEGDDVVVRLYNTDIATYYKDGRIQVDYSYNSNLTRNAINSVLGTWMTSSGGTQHFQGVPLNGEALILRRDWRDYTILNMEEVVAVPIGPGRKWVPSVDKTLRRNLQNAMSTGKKVSEVMAKLSGERTACYISDPLYKGASIGRHDVLRSLENLRSMEWSDDQPPEQFIYANDDLERRRIIEPLRLEVKDSLNSYYTSLREARWMAEHGYLNDPKGLLDSHWVNPQAA